MGPSAVRPRRYPNGLLAAARLVERTFAAIPGTHAWPAGARRDPTRLVVERRVETARPPPGGGLTILHLSDLHLGPFLSTADLARLAAAAPAADLVCLTGDFVTHRAEDALGLGAALAPLRARIGKFAVFGNHDYRERREGEIARELEAAGVTVLRNRGRTLRGGLLHVAGVEDAEEGKVVDLDAALARRPERAFSILLAHHPDLAAWASRRGVDLVLSGHTHGGQIVLAGRSLFPARSAHRHGVHRVGRTTLSVSAGLGLLVVPIRVGAPAEAPLLRVTGPGAGAPRRRSRRR